MRKAFLILGSLLLGLFLGMMTPDAPPFWREAAEITGTLWLNALRMTVIPLIIALLITGIAQTAQAARGGRLAARAVAMMLGLLFLSSLIAAMLVPALTALFPIPAGATEALHALLQRPQEAQHIPSIGEFLRGIVPTNPFAAAAEGAILPLIVFVFAFAFAVNRLPEGQRTVLTGFFEAAANALILVIGWILWLAPIGVLALAFGLGQTTGAAAFGALAHYVAVLILTGGAIWIGAVLLAIFGARIGPLRFFRATVPAQAVAISTQSSLASLPAMLQGLDQLGTRRPVSEVILPVAVTLFRATGPAMNLGVALYIAHWLGVQLSPWQIALGIAVATVTTIGSVSLPGTISFISSIAPICLAMGLPIEPLGLLVAVETFPDIMRTLANVTMDMAVTATLDERTEQGQPPERGQVPEAPAA
ncbi:MAG: dicarboxylate/amino acid:cation symporter [Sphingobium sp.]